MIFFELFFDILNTENENCKILNVENENASRVAERLKIKDLKIKDLRS